MNSKISIGDIVKLPTGEVEILDFEFDNNVKYIQYKCLSCGQTNRKRASPKTFIKCGCPTCYKETKSKVHIGDIIKLPTGNVEILDVYYSDKKRYIRYKCSECGQISEKISGNFEKNGCPVCSNRVVIKGVNDITTTDRWMIPYFKGGENEASLYTHSSSKKIIPVCPYCHKIKDKEISIYQLYNEKRIGCICGDGISYPNKFMYRLLQIKNLEFISEYSPKWNRPKRYDFYIPAKNLIIEMDGGIGHGHCADKSFGVTPQQSLLLDEQKDKKASEHGLTVIRIDSIKSQKDYIGFNCKNKLADYIKITEDDLIECDRFATKNIVKIVCDYYNEYHNCSTLDIAKRFGFSQQTIWSWLKKGKDLGWCNYNVEHARMNRAEHARMTMRQKCKHIYVYDKNGLLLKEYDSITDCISNSKLDFGFNFYRSSVYRVLEGREKSYHSLILSYSNQ